MVSYWTLAIVAAMLLWSTGMAYRIFKCKIYDEIGFCIFAWLIGMCFIGLTIKGIEFVTYY